MAVSTDAIALMPAPPTPTTWIRCGSDRSSTRVLLHELRNALGGVEVRVGSHRAGHRSQSGRVGEQRPDLTARLPEVKVPTLLVWGDADPISPPAVGRHLAKLLPHAELVVIAGGEHGLARDRAADVAPHVVRHLG